MVCASPSVLSFAVGVSNLVCPSQMASRIVTVGWCALALPARPSLLPPAHTLVCVPRLFVCALFSAYSTLLHRILLKMFGGWRLPVWLRVYRWHCYKFALRLHNLCFECGCQLLRRPHLPRPALRLTLDNHNSRLHVIQCFTGTAQAEL